MSLTKTKEEIILLKEGGARLARIVKSVSSSVKSGVSTKELDDLARELAEKGGDTPAFLGYTPSGAHRPYPASICISIGDEVVHGIPNEPERVLQEGEIVTIDMGLKHKGLITDMAVTVPVGEIDDISKKLLSVAHKARKIGTSKARAGNTTGDIGHAVEDYVKRQGFSVAHELGGHGVGRSVHEEPFVPNVGPPGSGETLVEGMVLAIEPIVCEGKGDVVMDKKDGYTYRTKDGKRSAQFEHTVLITSGEPEILTK